MKVKFINNRKEIYCLLRVVWVDKKTRKQLTMNFFFFKYGWLDQRNRLNSNGKMRECKLRSIRSKRKQGNKGKATSTTTFRIGLGRRWKWKRHQQSLQWEHCITFFSLSRYRIIETFLNIVLNFDPIHPIIESDIDENYDHVKIDVWQKHTHHRPMFN